MGQDMDQDRTTTTAEPGPGHRPRTTCQIPNPIFALSVCCFACSSLISLLCSFGRLVSQSISAVSQSGQSFCRAASPIKRNMCYPVMLYATGLFKKLLI